MLSDRTRLLATADSSSTAGDVGWLVSSVNVTGGPYGPIHAAGD